MKRWLFLSFCALVAVAAALVWWRPAAEEEFEELDEAAQDLIWAGEHVAFEIETRLGQTVCAGLKKRSATQVAYFLKPSARVTLADEPGQWELERSCVRQRGVEVAAPRFVAASDSATISAGPEALSEWFSGWLRDFAEVQRASLRVLRNRPLAVADGATAEGPTVDPEGWTIEALITVVGKRSDGSWLEAASRHELDCHFREDEDISAGGLIERWEVRSLILRDCSSMLFEEVTQAARLQALGLPDNWQIPADQTQQFNFQIAVEDFDRDGFLDIAAASIPDRPLLLRSIKGERYEDVTREMGLKPWLHGRGQFIPFLSWLDYDNDGYPDLLIGDRFYRNESGRQFVDVTSDVGLRPHPRGPMSSAVADYDCDGRLDLYLLYQGEPPQLGGESHPWVGDDSSGEPNQLWRNDGGRFVDATRAAGADGGARLSFAAAWLNLNEDRFPDLYVANDFGRNVLLENRGDGSFEDVTDVSGTGDFATSMGVAAGDLNDDGTPEIYVANMFSKMGRRIIAQISADDYPPGVYEEILGACAGNRLYRRAAGQEKFAEVSVAAGVNEVGWAFAPAMEDFDGDGRLDLYAATGFMSFERHKPDG